MSAHSVTLPDPQTLRPLLEPGQCKGIAWWISTLGCGGAERQVIVTGREFKRRGIPVSLMCQRLLNYRGDTHYLPQALEIFPAVHDLTVIPQKRSRHRKQRRKEIGRTVAEAWKAQGGNDFFLPANLRSLARKAFLREGSAPATIPGEEARQAAHNAALPFRGLFNTKEYAALEHHIACFVELKPALLHVWSAEQLYVPVAAVLAGVPKVIVSARQLSPHTRVALKLPSVNDKAAHALLVWLVRSPGVFLAALSHAVAKDFEKWLNLPGATAAVTRNAFDITAWPRPESSRVNALRAFLGIPESAEVIGGLARFVPQKDPELWLATAIGVLLKNTHAYAVLGGDGNLLEKCRKVARASLVADRIVLPGIIKDVSAFYSILSVFLLTSQVEGLGNVLLEAQYAGVPVVCTDAGGAASEVVQHGKTGWIVEKNDVDLLSNRTLSILHDKAWDAEARVAARDNIVNKFSMDKAINELQSLYFPVLLYAMDDKLMSKE